MLIVSVTSGILLCLLIVVARLVFTRRRPNDENSEQGKTGGQFKTSNTGETTITNGFSDDISEIDADIDLTTPLPMSTNQNITRNDVRRQKLNLIYQFAAGTWKIRPNESFSKLSLSFQHYNSYTPSPSPYGNLGPSNLSHTSSTLLMPQSSSISSSGTGPPSLMGGSINPTMIMPSSIAATGFGEFLFHFYMNI